MSCRQIGHDLGASRWQAQDADWELINAGQRVQIIKKDAKKGGILQFGTELVASEDGSMAALLGALPLMLGYGTGAELRQPLGITIVGGLVMSQLLTLYTTPVVYLFFDRLRLRFSRKNRTTVTE